MGNKYGQRLLYVAVTFLLPLSLSAGQPVKKYSNEYSNEECSNCHSSERTSYHGIYGKSGVKKWNDGQCFGCHEEINEVLSNMAEGIKDYRQYVLHSSQLKRRIDGEQYKVLPYMNAPEDTLSNLENAEIYDISRVNNYIKHPSKSFFSAAYGMVAFPSIESEENLQVDSGGDVREGEMIWHDQCSTCHNGVLAPDENYMAIFNPDYIFDYANGTIKKERTMPKVTISNKEAKNIFSYLGHQWLNKKQTLESELVIMRKNNHQYKLPDKDDIAFIWKQLFRVGGCVHCHDGENRAAKAFIASEEGLSKYLKKNGGMDFFHLLETRKYEVKYNLVSNRPGMPMNGPMIDDSIREKVLGWVKLGCPDNTEQQHCTSDLALASCKSPIKKCE